MYLERLYADSISDLSPLRLCKKLSKDNKNAYIIHYNPYHDILKYGRGRKAP